MKSEFSIEIGELAKALAAAQGEIKNPAKDKNNPHFKSMYADIASGIDSIRAAFSKHNIAYAQLPEIDGDQVILRTQIMHSSGQWMASYYPVSKVALHQPMGAAMTYAKRQALFAMAGIAGDTDDDDGNEASAPSPSIQAAKKIETDPDLLKKLITRLNEQENETDILKWVSSAGAVAALKKLKPEELLTFNETKDKLMATISQQGS
jgi:hypothetical protein